MIRLDVEKCRALYADLLPEESEHSDHIGDYLLELMESRGERVFAWEWCSGGPGAGAGIEVVYRLRGHYLSCSCDFGSGGPYASLEEALQAIGLVEKPGGQVGVNGATREVACSEWSDTELIARLDLETWEPPATLAVNGTFWYLEHLEHEQARLRGRR